MFTHQKRTLLMHRRVLLPVKKHCPSMSANFIVTSPQHQWRDAVPMVPMIMFNSTQTDSEFEYTIITAKDALIDVSAIIDAGLGYCTRLYTAITSSVIRFGSSHFAMARTLIRKNGNYSAEEPENILDRPPAVHVGERIIQDWAPRDNLHSVPMPTVASNPAKKIDKARHLYVKERTKQQQHLSVELANLRVLLNNRAIDEEASERYEKLLRIGYERERDKMRAKYGFSNCPTQLYSTNRAEDILADVHSLHP